MSFKTEIHDIDSFLRRISQGEHGCLFYLNREQKQGLLLAFLKRGLQNDELCVYATATENKEAIEDGMRRAGFQKFANSVSIVQGDDLYRSPANPDLKNWISSFDSLLKETERKGRKALRVAADLSSYFMKLGLIDPWFELESSIERNFQGRVTILCAYDANLVTSKSVTNILTYYKELSSTRNRRFLDVHNFAIFPFSNDKILILTLE